MIVTLDVRNTSRVKGCFRSDALCRLADRICAGEGISNKVEISLFFCDDERIQELNRNFRKEDRPTDVLSFGQERPDAGLSAQGRPAVLGDIVISLETVAGRCLGRRDLMRQEVRMLFCHGLLHLLGYDHATASERRHMAAKQAAYLEMPLGNAWPVETPT